MYLVKGGGFLTLLGLLALSTLNPASSWAVTVRDDVPDGNYLALGASADYAAVGTVASRYTGSGILIAPDWVLTAAHNILASSSGSFTINGTTYTADGLFRNPGYQPANPMAGYDFGLMHLSSSVSSIMPALLFTGSSELGQIGTFVGFGFTGTGLTGYRTLDNQKRAFQNMIDGDFGNPSLVMGCDFDNPASSADNVFGDPTPLSLEGCVAPGDSGGGVFITTGSQTYLAGVISFVAASDGNANSDYGDLSGYGRVAAVLPWITSTIPEPSAFTLLAAGGLAWLIRRR
jgi:hypothetical protein